MEKKRKIEKFEKKKWKNLNKLFTYY